MDKPPKSFWQIWNMSFGFLGIQFGWGLQMANMSAIYEYLGARADQIPILWLAAPLTGLLIQPIIGHASDRTWGGLGRRRPGDEIAMLGGDDPDNRRDFPGGFPGDPKNAFTQAGRTPEQQNVFDYVRSLLQLRQSHVALRQGRHHHVGWGENYYAFVRETETEKVLIVFNNAASEQEIRLPVRDTSLESARDLTPILGSANAILKDGTLEVALPAKTLGIYNVR
jgi:hypothetical protein